LKILSALGKFRDEESQKELIGKVRSEELTVQAGHSSRNVRDALLMFIAFLAIYIPFRSIDFDANGVIEAASLESGHLFTRNHITYRFAGSVVYRVAQQAGYSGRSIYLLQTLDGVCGAAGVALAFFAFLQLGASRRSAFAGAVLWGTSFIYWYFSTDVSYVVMAAAFAAAALVCSGILKKRASIPAALLLGLFLALATLTFQMACFLFPGLLWMTRRRIRDTALSVAVSVAMVGGSYLALAISEGHSAPMEILRWATTYGGGHASEWGRLEANRIPIAASAAVRSFQFDALANLSEFLANPFRKYLLRLMVGTVCYGALAVATFVGSAMQIRRGDFKLLWWGASYLIFCPFIVWFSPTESFWFLLPNLFLCGAFALIWKAPLERSIGFAFVFGTIAIMASFTFTSWIWPKHINPGTVGRKIDCIANNVRPDDMVIAPDWFWPASLSYFHDIKALQIIDNAVSFNDHSKLLEYMTSESRKTLQKGGRVLIVDPKSYSSEYLAWLSSQTSFSAADFDRFSGKFAFQCEDSKFLNVTGLNESAGPGKRSD
jgi:hypothetical protein